MKEEEYHTQVQESERKATYYKKIAQDCGERRLKETEELSRIIAKLRQTEKELAQARNELEQHVTELAETNRSLQSEIAERMRTETHLHYAREAADAANRAKSIFLANMSHELRTPLNAILGFTQLIEREQTLLPKHQDYLRIIASSGEHLLAVINDVLEMSKIEAGSTTLDRQSVDVSILLKTMRDMFAIRAQKKSLSLHIETEPDVPRFIVTDEHKLKQILINLLNNAIKFTFQGSITLHVSTHSLSSTLPGFILPKPHVPKIVPCSEPTIPDDPTHKIRFAVIDTGLGIPHNQIPILFQAFTQITNNQHVQEGTGLGLSISQHYIEAMHGAISVTSEVGKGSTFAFEIPLKETVHSPHNKKQSVKQVIKLAPGQPDYRILVIEDMWTNRTLITHLLESVHFQVKAATNGQEGIDICTNWHPHLIFMDIRMPGMDGYEATRAIKSTAQGQATTIIALTAGVFEDERANVLDAGCDDFIRKPFQETDIFEAIRKHLGIEYVYEDDHQSNIGDGDATETDISHYGKAESFPAIISLDVLPITTVEHLQHVALLGDIDAAILLIEEISTEYPSIGNTLLALAHNFRFQDIVAMTEPIVKPPL